MTNYDNESPNPWGLKNLIYIEYFLLAMGIILFLVATSVSVVPDIEPTPFPTQIPPPTETPLPIPQSEYVYDNTPQTINLYEYDLPPDSPVYRQNVIFNTDPCPQKNISNITRPIAEGKYHLTE